MSTPLEENKISVVIITKNEEEKIIKCLNSVNTFADEIIVIDDFSEDNTAKLCESFPKVKFFRREFTNFGEQRNFGIEKSLYPWIFSIDADEVISETLLKEITDLKANNDMAKVDGYLLLRKNFFWGSWLRHGACGPEWKLKLFKRTYRWEGDVHEKLAIPARKLKRLKGCLEHATLQTTNQWIEKARKYTYLQANSYVKDGHNFSLHNFLIRPLVYLGRSYFFRLGFLDGIPGLFWHMLGAFTEILIQIQIWELSKKRNYK